MLIIDDDKRREKHYTLIFNPEIFDLVFAWSKIDFSNLITSPFDGYVLDVFLKTGGWSGEHSSDAAKVLVEFIENAPRKSPVFLISEYWNEEVNILKILKESGNSKAKVVHYFTWKEFSDAIEEYEKFNNVERINNICNNILFELNRWHNYCPDSLDPNETINILCLADLQFGDPTTDPSSTFSERWVFKALDETNCFPELIFIAGDISYSGKPDEFAIAEDKILYDLITPIWGQHNSELMRERVIIVPGNHDVNLRLSACDYYDFDFKSKKLKTHNKGSDIQVHQSYALEPFRLFAKRLTKNNGYDLSDDLSWVDRRFLHWGIQIFVLNSVSGLNYKNPTLATIEENTIGRINRSLVKGNNVNIFNLGLSHHGLRSQGANKDETEISNWNKVGKELFSLQDIYLWICGHYHHYSVNTLQTDYFKNAPLWQVHLPTQRVSSHSRGFCVISLERQDGIVVNAYSNYYQLGNGGYEKPIKNKIFGKIE